MEDLISIPVDQLEPHPDNPRIADCSEIVARIEAAIRERGNFDPAHAIKVRPLNGIFQIVSGHNRTEAARRAGLSEIPAWVREMSDDDAAMSLVTDNDQRELRPLERGLHALTVIKKHDRNGGSIEAYAKAAGREAELQSVRREVWAAEVAAIQPRGCTSDLLPYARHLAELHVAPPEHWPALVERMVEEGWTVKDAQTNARKLVKREEVKRIVSVTLEEWKALKPANQTETLDWRERGYKAAMNEQDNDSIEWAKHSWNPVTGCLHNCPYCYARDIAERFYKEKFAPVLRLDRLAAPYQTALPPQAATDVSYRNVFTCSMADLFGKWVPKEWIECVLAVVRENPQWNFLFLTKFPLRMAEFEYPDNAWLGTSVDLQARVANAEKAMANVKASVKWLSLEPLIEPLRFKNLSAFKWVVIGGASRSTKTEAWGPPRRWVWDLTFQAQEAGCSVYHKTNLRERLRDFPMGHIDVEPKTAPAAFHYLKVID
jgi:ParB/RepB/Spo0J family partition protein